MKLIPISELGHLSVNLFRNAKLKRTKLGYYVWYDGSLRIWWSMWTRIWTTKW